MKLSENKQTFSFRKLTVGLASVTLATTFLAYHSSAQVKAAETTTENVSNSSENQAAARQATDTNQAVSNPATADSNIVNANATEKDANADALSDKTETSLNNNSANATNSEAANKTNLEASREESKDRPFVAMLAANAKAETVTRPKITPESAPEVISPKITSDLASEDSGSATDVNGKTVNPSDPRPWKQTKSGQDTINIHWVFADNSVTSSNASLVVDPDLGGQKVRDDAKIVYQKYELTRKEPELSASVNVGDIDFGGADKFTPVLAYGLRAPNEHISDVTYSGSEVSAGSGSILIRNDLASEGTTADPIPHIDLASPTDSFYQEGNIKGIPVPKISRNGHTYVAGSITVTGSPLHTNLGDYKLNVSLPLSSEYSGDNNYDITVYYFRDIKDDPIDVKVKYLDSDDGNRVVQEKTISGKVGEQVAVPTDIPENYEYQNKDSVPTEITINESLRNNSTPLEIHLVHVKKEVQVAKDVSRTVVGINPKTNEEFEITKQTAHFTGHSVKDMVTGKTTDPQWDESPIVLAKVTPTAISGYSPDTTEVASLTVTPAMDSFMVTVRYVANDGTQTIIYRDKTDGDVGKQTIDGKTDQTVDVTPKVPDGYVVKGEMPTAVTIKDKDTPIVVTVEHSMTHVDHDHPVDKGTPIPGTEGKLFPAGLTRDDLNKTVTRTVNIIDPHTQEVATTTQEVTFTRGATVDDVTGEITYGNWSENGKHIFDKVDVPYIPGYRASEEVPELAVTPDSKSTTVDVTYAAKTYDVYVFYINGTSIYDRKDFDKHVNGELGIAKPEVLRGHYGESINIPIKQIPGYYVNPYGHYSNYKFGIDNVTGQELSWYDFSPTGDKDLKDPLPEDASDLDKEYSMPRYIPVVYIKDDADKGYNIRGYNIGYIDTDGAVIGRPTNLRGIPETDTNFVAPTFAGYTLTNPQDVPVKFGKRSQDIFLVYKPQDVKVTYRYVDEAGKVLAPSVVENNHFTGLIKVDENTKQIDGYSLVSTPKERVVDSLKDLYLSFVYAAKDGTQTIIYQDEGGSEVSKQVIPGKTDETVKVTLEVPAGYVIKTEIPKEVTIKPKDEPITITVTHKVITINHDNPVDEGQPIPGESGQKYPAGLNKDDLNKTIVREIEFNFPSGKKSVITQSVTFTRDATLDLATGEVAYKPWSENGKHTLVKVEAPEIKGYVATSEAPSIVVTPESPICTKVQIDYKAVKGSKVTPGTGTTDETVNVPEPNVPEEWHIAGNLPGKAVIQPEDKTVTVTVSHNVVRVTRNKTVKFDNGILDESSSKFPSGSIYNNLNSTNTQVARPTAVTASSVMDVAQASHTPQMQTQVAQLPQTGAEDGSAIVALGLVLISLSAIGFAARKRG